tara:strand:+ start:4414 stop:4701 length:288 start_codon:yes stop_codon:yes gene_type:complete
VNPKVHFSFWQIFGFIKIKRLCFELLSNNPLHWPSAWVKGGLMETKENDNKFVFELNLKLQMKDYRLRYVTKKGWIVALILIAIKLGFFAVRAGP